MAFYRFRLETWSRRRRKVADWLDKGKGPWWLKPLPQLRNAQRRARSFIPRAYAPPRVRYRHRFPSWLVQQGAYWITNVPQHRKAQRRIQTPAWVISPKRYHRRFRVVFVYQLILLVQQAWNWHGQAGVLGLTLGTVSKAWAWVANAPSIVFSLGMVSKAWNWIARPAIINLPVAMTGKFNIARGVVWGVIRGVLNRPRIGP